MHYHVVSFQEYCCQVTKDRCPGFFLYYTKHAFLIFTLLKLSYCLTLMFDSNEFFILFTCKYIPYLTLLNPLLLLFTLTRKRECFLYYAMSIFRKPKPLWFSGTLCSVCPAGYFQSFSNFRNIGSWFSFSSFPFLAKANSIYIILVHKQNTHTHIFFSSLGMIFERY